ncbi:MAG TPA: terminase [Terriglobales bacterium]|nr:terminase [Terriglobales bacterium]
MIGDILLLQRLGAALEFRPRYSGESSAVNSGIVEDSTIQDLLIEGLLKVRNKDRKLVRLKPNRAQREFSRTCTKRNIVLKARQMGITTYVAARFFVQTITQPGTVTVQVAHNQDSAEEIFQIVHRFWENLPEGMQRGALVRSRASIRQIAFPRLDSEYRIATAADANAGRGMTIHNLHCSEVARWPRDGEESLASLRAAVPEDGNIVIESTPNGAGGVFYEEWQRTSETGYARHFFPWWYEDAYRNEKYGTLGIRTSEEDGLAHRYGLVDEQLAWRRINRAQLRGLAAQEYAEDPVSCFRASGECVFDLEIIEQAQRASCDAFEVRDNDRLITWFPPQTSKQYIIGVDPAGGGTEGDYSCAQVIERSTGMQCAELHGHFPPRELANRIAELAKVYNRALLAVERNNHGYGVLAHLRTQEVLNIFRDGGQDGWLTSAVSRPAMIENLVAVLAVQPSLFQSGRFLNECRTFVRHVDGSSGAMVGTHDDCVMAMAIAMGARRKAVGDVPHSAALELASLSFQRPGAESGRANCTGQ